MRPEGRAEAGFSLVGALAGITIMLTLMGMAVPAWRYVMQDDREEELIFRGSQIVDAIDRCQKERKGGLPVSLEFLVQKKCLRKLYTDPMTKHGKWRLIHPGEALPPVLPPGAGGRPGKPGADTGRLGHEGADQGPQFGARVPGASVGPILGVASTSKEKSLRLFNGRSRYDQWIFAVGMPRIVGKMPLTVPGMEPRPGAGAAKPR
jgi:type II secretory pathway pseudopilin PulG